MGKYVLWKLNRIVGWRPADVFSAALARQKHSVRDGDRNAFNLAGPDPEPSLPGELMHEGNVRPKGTPATRNEYFVPILLKCIGDPIAFERRHLAHLEAANTLPRWQKTKAYLNKQLASLPKDPASHPVRSYWTPHAPDSMAMNTSTQPLRDVAPGFTLDPYFGLYDIVRLERKDPAERAVLVGYSQGGVVARYLAFLDELFPPADRVIAGVVTVDSPNFGSPVARKKNDDSVANGVLRAAAGIAGTAATTYPALGKYLEQVAGVSTTRAPSGTNFHVQSVAEACDAIIEDFKHFDRAQVEARMKTYDMAVTTRKWLTGLIPQKVPTAFNDLDVTTMVHHGSVLHDTNVRVGDYTPLAGSYQGAVIGANSRLTDFIESAFDWPVNLLAHFVLKFAGNRAVDAQVAYRGSSLIESSPLPANLVPDTPADYQNGVSVLDISGRATFISPLAHDFIVPSASQAIGPRGTLDAPPRATPHTKLLGNFINARAAHLSGAANDPGPASQHEGLIRLLKKMGDALD